MTVDEHVTGTTPSTTTSGLKLRSSSDRCCPNCNEVALAFDADAGRARCRVCGELDR